MRRRRRNRIILAWVLLFTLMPMGIVKATHLHVRKGAVAMQAAPAGAGQSVSQSDSCPICHFFVSPFVEAPVLRVSFCARLVAFFVAPPCAGVVKAGVLAASLRAPPSGLLG